MKIALFGATGTIGQRILKEALDRGHEVTAIVRDPAKLTVQSANLRVETADALNPDQVANAVRGHDVVVSSIGSAPGQEQTLIEATKSLIEGVKRSGVRRLIAVGGAGSLEVAPGVQLMNTPDFPQVWKAIAQAHADALAIYRKEADLEWTNVSPAAFIEPGERTGRYRVGTEQLVVNDQGESRISAEDFAVAILDEVENPRFVRQRFTVAY
jgi:putative NADH-flavin reductase